MFSKLFWKYGLQLSDGEPGRSSWHGLPKVLYPENSDIQVDFGTHMMKYIGRLFLKTSAISVQNLQSERFNKAIQCDQDMAGGNEDAERLCTALQS